MLPISNFKSQIISTVSDNLVTVIQAETGAGKSTQVPQYLLDEGYDVLVTQPRRIAAVSLAERVCEERGSVVGREVGYATSDKKCYGDHTKLLFVTDGLALVRELLASRNQRKNARARNTVLVIDETHEWNVNIEVLAAWAKHHVNEENFRVVLMSATLEAEKLSAYYDNAPVITVPGRTFPVEEVHPSTANVATIAMELLVAGRNVLVFQPGKKEISDCVDDIRHALMGFDTEVLPLHGELSVEDQRKVFKSYFVPKCIVSTNIAQTSVTIADIDAVIDTCVEKRVEMDGGIETLVLAPISKADQRQRKGRAGRTKPGIYIPMSGRVFEEYPKAEIERSDLTKTYLRLLYAGYDMSDLDFFHQPTTQEIERSKQILRVLGCMTPKGQITPLGKRIARLPLSVELGKLIVEAESRGCVQEAIAAAAVVDAGGILERDRRPAQVDATSDVLTNALAFERALVMSRKDMKESEIHSRAYDRAKVVYLNLLKHVNMKPAKLSVFAKRKELLASLLAASLHSVYVRHHNWAESYDIENGRSGLDSRRFDNRSFVNGSTEFCLGKPFNIQAHHKTVELLTMITLVTKEELLAAAPHLVKEEVSSIVCIDGYKFKFSIHKHLLGRTIERTEIVTDRPTDVEVEFNLQWLLRAFRMWAIDNLSEKEIVGGAVSKYTTVTENLRWICGVDFFGKLGLPQILSWDGVVSEWANQHQFSNMGQIKEHHLEELRRKAPSAEDVKRAEEIYAEIEKLNDQWRPQGLDFSRGELSVHSPEAAQVLLKYMDENPTFPPTGGEYPQLAYGWQTCSKEELREVAARRYAEILRCKFVEENEDYHEMRREPLDCDMESFVDLPCIEVEIGRDPFFNEPVCVWVHFTAYTVWSKRVYVHAETRKDRAEQSQKYFQEQLKEMLEHEQERIRAEQEEEKERVRGLALLAATVDEVQDTPTQLPAKAKKKSQTVSQTPALSTTKSLSHNPFAALLKK